jgi:uncharacterized protein
MNRLGNESSPYLRQHAANPVEWYPWGDEALERARREDRPIFLSVGYSACHWCHVMAHESFEDPETAALLNGHFIAIKVDREERPDVDALYMRSVMLMTGSGGWPLSVFLTPSLKPFFGGTYFPPDSRGGMTGFRDLLEAVAAAFRDRRDEIEESAGTVFSALSRSLAAGPAPDLPGSQAARAASEALLSWFDDEEGGFGRGPKFPQPALLEFLLNEDGRRPEVGLGDKVLFTLHRMEAGGVRDQVGGGFHRYAVDREWRVPHFEKMLYDNAQLASLYFKGFQRSGDESLLRVGREILKDLKVSLGAPGGGFYASLDADSEGQEGKFYLWEPGEILEALGSPGAERVCDLYGVSGGPDLEGQVLHRRRSWGAAAAEEGDAPEAFRERIEKDLTSLKEAREDRPHPGLDTKVLTDWNALAATAFLDGYLATGDGLLLATGLETLEVTWRRGWNGNSLMHVWDGSRAKVPGFLADYAYLASASWRAYEATGSPRHLESVRILLDAAVLRFRDASGGFLDAPSAISGLPLHVRGSEDGVLPSGVGVLAGLLWNWERLTDAAETRALLDGLLRSDAEPLRRQPAAMPLLADLAACRTGLRADVVIAAPSPGPDSEALLRVARRATIPRLLVLPLYGRSRGAGDDYALFLGRRASSGAAAYVCVGTSCGPPIREPGELEKKLREIAASPGAGGGPYGTAG